jgi:hypothetical protein
MIRTVLIFMTLFLSFNAQAQDPKELVKEVNLQASPVDEQVDMRMKLVDNKGNIRERTATLSSRRIKADSWVSSRLIKFYTPPEMANSAVLIIEKLDADNQQWIYLPATYTTRQIPSQKRGDRYMGTDFSYEDAAQPQVDQYSYASRGTETVDSIACKVVEQTPSEPKLVKESAYARTVLFVDPKLKVIRKAEYYNHKGDLAKRYIATSINNYKGHFRPDHIEMHDLGLKHQTIVDYSNRIIGKGLSESLFTVRAIERIGQQ